MLVWVLFISFLPFFGSQQLLAYDGSGSREIVAAEYKLKAALIYKLTRFVTWPQFTNSTTNQVTAAGFNICVLGTNPFGGVLEPLRNRKAKGENIRISYFAQSEEINKPCHLLYISDSKQAFVESIVKRFSRQATLTLSDISGFASRGGMIELTKGKKTIGFSINPKQAKLAGISFAAPLLELAKIVETHHVR